MNWSTVRLIWVRELRDQLRDRRTLFMILVLPLVLLVLFVRTLPGFHLDEVPGVILRSNGLLLFAAFAVFYLGFPLRGLRWAILVRRTGFPSRNTCTLRGFPSEVPSTMNSSSRR